MDRNYINVDELVQFIDDTRQGKYTDGSCEITQVQAVRYDYEVVEDINRESENVILYGLSC